MSELHPIIREIKQRRIALGLSQTAVAKAAGISKAAVCEIEKGNHKPNLDTLNGLARGVGLTLTLGQDRAELAEGIAQAIEALEPPKLIGRARDDTAWVYAIRAAAAIARGYTRPEHTGTPHDDFAPHDGRLIYELASGGTIADAYRAARSARFEHGESGAML